MSRKWMILGVTAMAVVLAGCTAAGSQPCTVNCTVPTAVNQRMLSVNGEGRVGVTPDIAIMSLSVISRDSFINTAWDDNNAKTAAAITAIKSQGVADADIRSDFSVYQQERYDQVGQPTGEFTYVVTHSLTVKVRDLTKIGAILGAAQAAGVNSVGGISFTLEDPASAVSQARALAVADARARAEELAEGLGVKVGRVLTVNEYGVSVPMSMDKVAYGMGGGGSSVPIQTGSWEVTMSVSVVFEIE